MITLATLESATPQKVFDQVARHLLKQAKQSRTVIDDEGAGASCAYRGDNGLKCAAGCLISDDEYDPEMEGLDWGNLVADFKVTSKHLLIIRDLQTIHDNVWPDHWEFNLKRLAERRNLTFKLDEYLK